jgi:hypothetical protein
VKSSIPTQSPQARLSTAMGSHARHGSTRSSAASAQLTNQPNAAPEWQARAEYRQKKICGGLSTQGFVGRSRCAADWEERVVAMKGTELNQQVRRFKQYCSS